MSLLLNFSILSTLLLTLTSAAELFLSSPQSSPQSSSSSSSRSDLSNPFIMDDIILDDNDLNLLNNNNNNEELSIDDDYLQQMAKYATKQMSTKQIQYKLISLDSVEKSYQSSVYRLRVTLKKFLNNNNKDKHSILYCTIELNDNLESNEWELESYGCTIPAMIRIRNNNKIVESQPKLKPISNEIINDNEEKIMKKWNQYKQQQQQPVTTKFLPYFYHNNLFQIKPPMMNYHQPKSTYSYQEIRPHYRFYY